MTPKENTKNLLKFNYTITKRIAGYWGLDKEIGIQFPVEIKPNWLQRKIITSLLGWSWKDK
jgi:hypothetical protein